MDLREDFQPKGRSVKISDNAPFGSPDGASEDPGTFIDFSDPGIHRDLALPDTDRRVRVLVGRRGSGKTRYLRKLMLSIIAEPLLNYPQRDTKVSLDNLQWIHRVFPNRDERLEVWEKLWSCAIYAGVASFLLNGKRHPVSDAILSERDKKFLQSDARSLLPEGPRERPIVAVLNNIIETYRDRSRLTSYLNDPRWFSLESIILDVIDDDTPLFAFIDTLDDNYGTAPAESTDAQVGLLTCILRKIVDPSVTNRLHVVVTVRDVIYSALLETDNGQRYNDRQYIRCLDWNARSSQYYLRKKIESLAPYFCVDTKVGGDPIKRWLGFSEFRNDARGGAFESVEMYLLRHTRFLPREINEMGNTLAKEIRTRQSYGEPLTPKVIRKVVSMTARQIAIRMIKEVALHMAALDGAPDGEQSFQRPYTDALMDSITTFIQALGMEKVSKTDLQRADVDFCASAPWWGATSGGHNVDVWDIMWQHGLIGYRRSGDPEGWVRFYHSSGGIEGDTQIVLPNADHYFLHSALLDIFNLKTEPKAFQAHAD